MFGYLASRCRRVRLHSGGVGGGVTRGSGHGDPVGSSQMLARALGFPLTRLGLGFRECSPHRRRRREPGRGCQAGSWPRWTPSPEQSRPPIGTQSRNREGAAPLVSSKRDQGRAWWPLGGAIPSPKPPHPSIHRSALRPLTEIRAPPPASLRSGHFSHQGSDWKAFNLLNVLSFFQSQESLGNRKTLS